MSLAVTAQQVAGYSDDRNRILLGTLKRLEQLSQRRGGYLEALREYAGELSSEEMARDLLGRAPAILVMVGDATYGDINARGLTVMATYEVMVFVVSSHLRSHEARATGDQASVEVAQADPGANRILYDVRDLLLGWNLAISSASVLAPRAETVFQVEDSFTVWLATYETRVEACQQNKNANPYDLERVDSDFNLVDADEVNPVVETVSTND